MRTIADISPRTAVCAIIGDPVAHSMSPAIHNAAFSHLGLDFVYVGFRVLPDDLRDFLSVVRRLPNWRGLSVTIPHKLAAASLVDTLSPVDAAIGSINTVINENGALRGLGTDGPGARRALLEGGIDPAGRRVLVVGTGGAARAIALDLAYNAPPAQLTLVGVEPAQCAALAQDVAATGVPVDTVVSQPPWERLLQKTDLLINASPVGMHPHTEASPVPAPALHPDVAVMDIVYNPLHTRLIRDARSAGCRTVLGVDMFVYQAVAQFEAFTGEAAPVDVMRAVVTARLGGGA